jgi:hypothetical protein
MYDLVYSHGGMPSWVEQEGYSISALSIPSNFVKHDRMVQATV